MKGVKSLNRDFQLNKNMSVDIRYADDKTLISAVFEKCQLSVVLLFIVIEYDLRPLTHFTLTSSCK